MRFVAGKFGQPECVVDDAPPGGQCVSRRLSDLVDAQNESCADAPAGHPEMDRLIRTIWRLRQPDGCPWDREQTHASITKNMVEEAYEAVDAIDAHETGHLCEELGDVLEQVVLHAQIAADAGEFDIDDVARGLNEKLVRRHPHVFGDLARDVEGAVPAGYVEARPAGAFGADAATGPAAGAEPSTPADEVGPVAPAAPTNAPAPAAAPADGAAVLDIWDDVKRLERAARGELSGAETGLLDSVPASLPALMQAQKISKRAAKAGFEWETTADVWAKVAEERAEFEAEEPGSDAAALEFGDLLFALVNVARKEGIDAEEALAASNRKFRRRWARMESLARDEGAAVEELGVDALNALWDRAKAEEKPAR